MQRIKYTSIIILILISVYYITNRIFKVNYSENDIVIVDIIKINDSLTIKNAFVVLGKNYKGFIEATAFPATERRYRSVGIVDYYYLRFHPSWYKKNIEPGIKKKLKSRSRLGFELVEKAKKAHDDNFHNCCHLNDYPIVKEGLLFTRISLLGVADKITMLSE